MNITFGQAHIRTLIKLQALAEKHNCSICFGTNYSFDADADIEDFKPYFDDLTDEVIEDINDNLIKQRIDITSSHYWFELYDRNTSKSNSLTYTETRGYAQYEGSCDSLEDKTEIFFENNGADWSDDYIIHFYRDSQTIQGFKDVDQMQINVYREGMLLKFFGDLVCDYLGEERIHEVY